MVDGELPAVFACSEEDRRAQWPPGTPALRSMQVLGLSPFPADATDRLVLTFSQASAGRGRVPTALDAFTHQYFLAPQRRWRWGRTWDLVSYPRRRLGVRECVVRPFPAQQVTQFGVIEV